MKEGLICSKALILVQETTGKQIDRMYEASTGDLTEAAYYQAFGERLKSFDALIRRGDSLAENAISSAEQKSELVETKIAFLRSTLPKKQRESFDEGLELFEEAYRRSKWGLVGALGRHGRISPNMISLEGKIILSERQRREGRLLPFVDGYQFSPRTRRRINREKRVRIDEQARVIYETAKRDSGDHNEMIYLSPLQIRTKILRDTLLGWASSLKRGWNEFKDLLRFKRKPEKKGWQVYRPSFRERMKGSIISSFRF